MGQADLRGIELGRLRVPLPHQGEQALVLGNRPTRIRSERTAAKSLLTDEGQALQGARPQRGIERRTDTDVNKLVSGEAGLVEAILSPQTTLEGKTLRQINFREKFGLNVLALWRKGRAYRSNLRDMELRFGDALLLLGPRPSRIAHK